jgi:hypothetical protein
LNSEPRFVCYVTLPRSDPRYSPILDGDELQVAEVSGHEAFLAVQRLFEPQNVYAWKKRPFQLWSGT